MSDDILFKSGQRARTIRKLNDLTLEDVSAKCGLHPSSISQFERGERNLTLRNISRLAEGLDVEPFQFLLFDREGILDDDEAEQFKVKEMFKTAPEDKKELMYNLSEILLEQDS